VVAETRHQAEDALAYLRIEWEELPVVANMERALDPDSPLIHPELGDNLCFTRTIDNGSVDATFASADVVVEESYRFGRHTGVTMETRSVLADFNAADHTLTVYHSHQAPHMMQDLYSRHLNLPEASVRVICKDVGGSFGIKVHSYPDDFATVALSKLLKRPIKFIADRLESFVSDVHARDHLVKARLAATKDGRILAFEIDDLTGVGPYSVYPRTSGIEGNQVINITGGPYQHANYRARLRVVFQNKPPMSQYRGVGHPIACAVTEGIVDLAASRLGIDPLAFSALFGSGCCLAGATASYGPLRPLELARVFEVNLPSYLACELFSSANLYPNPRTDSIIWSQAPGRSEARSRLT
jgi:carbon-monoxide dehydrogenase large subunit